MMGSLWCGHFSDKYGHKTALVGNCIFMIVGGVVQASVSNIWLFALGRLVAGISSGTATVTIGGYVNELSPPHMRNTLGLGLQIFTTIGILFPAITQSPCSQQLSGINAVFYYSGSIFSDAGISDSRVSTLIIAFINIWPAFFTGVLANRFGARNMILWGLSGMVVMSIGTTLAFVVDVSALSIVFTALYVIVFGVTLGPLVWVMTADIFPDSIRASASSLCIGINWLCNLIVGVAHPYI
ncbi:hypothetical protein BBJ29_010177 [Phytophthora kernoviae]|uniref:Major facilitator superfamily (MFS) profile domain-containing protein n=1 Tax=Phytophthora kernoviae TaxID=325452 RepID=A0A3R7N8J3_9STRA|nr:hypothetical protein BBJ29_010177 [Phytophthora kernoviae]